jgi:hypothetical protein
MGWVVAAVLAGGLGIMGLVMLRIARRLTVATALLETDGGLLAELGLLLDGPFGGDLGIEDGVAAPPPGGAPDPEPREPLAGDLPDGCISCGIDVVDAAGRVVGTVVVPEPVCN